MDAENLLKEKKEQEWQQQTIITILVLFLNYMFILHVTIVFFVFILLFVYMPRAGEHHLVMLYVADDKAGKTKKNTFVPQ